MLRVLRFVGWYIALTIVAALGMLVLSFPNYPKTLMGWVWFFVLALPVTLVGESVGEIIFRNRVTQAVETKTSGQSLSWLRIGYMFVVMLLVFGMLWSLALFFGIEGKQ